MEQDYSLLRAAVARVKFETWGQPIDGESLTPHAIQVAETRLGFKLPRAYIEVLKRQNGGFLATNYFVGIPGYSDLPHYGMLTILGLGGENGIDSPRDGKTLNAYLIDNWGYPERSVIVSHEGHGGFALDYSDCNNTEEPRVVYVDAERYPLMAVTYKIAPDFTSFLLRLEERYW